eukprot:4780423-Prymnesium_polylepis.1
MTTCALLHLQTQRHLPRHRGFSPESTVQACRVRELTTDDVSDVRSAQSGVWSVPCADGSYVVPGDRAMRALCTDRVRLLWRYTLRLPARRLQPVPARVAAWFRRLPAGILEHLFTRPPDLDAEGVHELTGSPPAPHAMLTSPCGHVDAETSKSVSARNSR